ncbi:MAG TPA: hypothetical protein VG870_00035 [Chitinophagaceae bacterium]|nr:hypothetical protein [Chitinophagaceae bacterium]
MKSSSINPGRTLAAAALTGLCITLLSWNGQDTASPHQAATAISTPSDTVPAGDRTDHVRKIRDLDQALEDLDKAKIDIDLDQVKQEMSRIRPELEKQLDQAKREMDRAIREMDVDKIKAQVEASVKQINWDQMKADLDKARQVDLAKIQVDMEKVNKQLDDMKPQIEKQLREARVQVEMAKQELKEYKGFVDQLNKDGLIDKKKDYTIEHRDGQLLINGVKQPDSVYGKYRAFLDKHPRITLRKTDDDFRVD